LIRNDKKGGTTPYQRNFGGNAKQVVTMKTFLFILSVFFSFLSNGQEKEKLTVVPKTVEETFPLLDQM
jgi:hypothetical protein